MTDTRIRITTVASLLLILPLPARAWTPVDCASRGAELEQPYQEFWGESRESLWADHLEELAAAKEGERLYAPAPFPKTSAEIVENVEYAYFERLFDDSAEVPTEEWPIYSGLQGGTLRLEVVRVENWGTSRCSSDLPNPYYDLVRAYDKRGQELARFAMHHTGLMGRYAHVTPIARDALRPIEEVIGSAAEALAGSSLPEAGKYVAVDGVAPHCDVIIPCVALKSGATTYIWSRGESIYAISNRSQRQSITARKSEAIRTRSLVALHTDPGAEFAWVSLGFEWVKAQRVWPVP